MDAVRAMLDELMGKERNVPLSQRSNKAIRFDDPSVCKYQLAGLCPNRLFKNTRSDLGACQYETHDDHLDWPQIQEDYNKTDERDKERYERKLIRYLDELIKEMDRKITKAKDRAEKESAPRELRPEDQAKLTELQQRAKEALEKSQQLGEEGDVDESMRQDQAAEAYKKQHDELFKRLTAPDRTMTVCDICGVFINSTDNEARRRDHLEGKQYLGWKAIREKYAELTAKYEKPRSSSYDRERAPSKEPERQRERERSPGRYDREREYKDSRSKDYGRDPRDYGRDPRDYRERDYRGRGGEVAPPRDPYRDSRGGGYRERDRYMEDPRDRRRY